MRLWLFAIVVAGAMAGLVLVELIARRYLRWAKKYFVNRPGLRIRICVDQDVLPGFGTAEWKINRDGERGAEPPQKKNTYRILVAGGSAAEGYLLDQNASWPGFLEQMLQDQEPRKRLGVPHVHVGNIGRSSVASTELALILEKVLPRYSRIDLLLIMVGGSDVVNWLECNTPPVWDPPPMEATELFRFHPEGPFKWDLRRLALTEVLRRAKYRWLKPLEVREGTGKTLKKLREKRSRAKEILTEVGDPSPLLNNFEKQLYRAVSISKRYADRVLVVCQPFFQKNHSPEELAMEWNFGVNFRDDAGGGVYYSLEVVGWLMSLLNERAKIVADTLGVESLDIMPDLERSTRTFYDFIHFTPYGAELVASRVAEFLVRPKPVNEYVIESGYPTPILK